MFNIFIVYRTPTLTVPPNHEYLDERTGVLAAMLAKRARLHGLAFPTPAGPSSRQATAQTGNQLRTRHRSSQT